MLVEVVWMIFLISTRPFESRMLNRIEMINQGFLNLFLFILLIWSTEWDWSLEYITLIQFTTLPLSYILIGVQFILQKIALKQKEKRLRAQGFFSDDPLASSSTHRVVIRPT